ncbi:MAG: DUF59 domain-containing protein [Acidobacteria bacterium]|nr:MAG: DUF59 domain-containing protein [Acidobacteriota bacterium]REJ99549.1 MAG: DUF59 domain-containing protein [Acidobacteriota bacterium]
MFWRSKKREELRPEEVHTTEVPGDGDAADDAKAVADAEVAAGEGAGDGAAAEPAASAGAGAEVGAAEPVTQERVIEALSTVYDPEIPVNIYELGLIYGVLLRDSSTRPGGTDVDVKMTLTSPHCPVAETLPGDVARAVRTVTGVGEVDVEVVWDPTWNPDMMSEAAKLELGMF